MNVTLRMYKYYYSSLGAIYVKGLLKVLKENTVNPIEVLLSQFPTSRTLKYTRHMHYMNICNKNINYY